ncbi:MAG: VWA domain-containing protein [Pseudomonadota bacterium]|jgi:Ca-activated chloride channel family protein|nr:VWA domain-containing protein [Pseudomonadota bacterium]MED5310107.1 VWA domain-containing protein [Pseudomonadota bacterium]|tara:strand:- start:113 stop:1105 length:993 start_codon:yes stop_codon:yes gene_type:complete
MLSFVWPWFYLILPLPFLYRKLRRSANSESPYLESTILLSIAETQNRLVSSTSQRRLLILLLIIAWLSLVTAIARPVNIGDPVALPTTGRDILLAVDISGSMEREDMIINGRQVNRLYAVKSVVSEFVNTREGDRLGLILFGERAYLQTPLTFDTKTLQDLLIEAQIGFAGNGTAIGDAIGLSVKKLKERPDSNRVLILLTDGSNTAGVLSPSEASDIAKKAKVKIYTIGIGDGRQRNQGLFGQTLVNQNNDLDERTLTAIADLTGGKYFRARDPRELRSIYDQLNKLEPIDQDEELLRPITSLFHWPLALFLTCSLLIILIRLFSDKKS